MQLIENQKATSTPRRSKAYNVSVPAHYSRQDVMQQANTHSDVRGADVRPMPESDARRQLYLLHMKIGATNELPDDDDIRISYLNDFWRTIYLKNNQCPADIPFTIIFEEFTMAMVQGRAKRRGNNQAAIVQAFNSWLSDTDVRNRLYQLWYEKDPDAQPKQLPENATPETVTDYSDEELQKKLSSIKPFAGICMVDRMIEELEDEVERRR